MSHAAPIPADNSRGARQLIDLEFSSDAIKQHGQYGDPIAHGYGVLVGKPSSMATDGAAPSAAVHPVLGDLMRDLAVDFAGRHHRRAVGVAFTIGGSHQPALAPGVGDYPVLGVPIQQAVAVQMQQPPAAAAAAQTQPPTPQATAAAVPQAAPGNSQFRAAQSQVTHLAPPL